MTKNILVFIFLAMGLLLFQEQAHGTIHRTPTAFDNGALVVSNDSVREAEAIFSTKSPILAFTHFTWGAEVGSSIDLTGNNMSTFDLDINLGFKNSLIKVAGIGIGFHRGIASGDTYIPIYALLRTSFRKKPSLFFMNIQAGYSFNTVQGSKYHGDFVSALGCGLNLTQSRRVKSYVILSVGSRYFNKNHKVITNIDAKYVTTAKLCIGLNF